MLRREERLKVLEMIEAGKIGVEDGMRLMKALEQAGGSEDPPAAVAGWMRLRVTQVEGGQIVTSLRLPLSVAFLLQRLLIQSLPGLDELDLVDLITAARSGETGRLLDVVESSEGKRIEIFVE
jgi:hypothetical protein